MADNILETAVANGPGRLDELSSLYRLTDRLYRARSLREVFDAALDAIQEALGCEKASILLFDEEGVMRFVAWRDLSDGYRRAVDGHSPWQPGERDPEPIYVEDIALTDEPQWLRDTITGEGIRALAFIPLVAKGEIVGKFMTYRSQPHDFSDHERELAVTIARQVGFSLEREIAEQARAGAVEALRQSEQRFRMMAEDAPVMIWVSGAQGQCLQLNRMLRRFWNVEEDRVGEFDWRDTMHPADADAIQAKMMSAMQSVSPVEVTGRYLSADGGYRILRTDARPYFDDEGAFSGMIGVNVDITQREMAERSLRASEQRFRDLAETVPQLVWTAGDDGIVEYWNSRIGDYSPDAIGPDGLFHWEGLLCADDLEGTRIAWEQAVENRAPFQKTHRLRMADGALRWHLSRANPVFEHDGAPARWFGTATDIHDRMLAEAMLRESERRQRIAVDSAGLGVFEWNAEGDQALWENERMWEIFNRDHGEGPIAFREFMRSYIHPDDRALFLAALKNAQNSEEVLRTTLRIVRPPHGEARTLDVSGRYDFDADGRPARLVGVVADITERKATEDHRKLLIDELNHRVKNTLAVVQALARQTFRPGGSEYSALAAFEGRLGALAQAHNLLANESWESASVADVAHQSLLARGEEAQRIRLDGPMLMLKPKQAVTLAMALHELYTNAVKYGSLSTPDGSVDFVWRVMENGEPRIVIEWEEKGGPPVGPPARQGFGSMMIRQAIASELGAEVTMDFRPQGLRCVIDGPLRSFGGAR